MLIKKKVLTTKDLTLRDKSMEFDFREYKSLKKRFKEIYYWKLSIDRTEDIAKGICWYTNYIRKIQTNKT